MIIVDNALQKREAEGKPIRVGIVGAGFMARGVAMQICNVVPGMQLCVVSNRNIEGAVKLYEQAGVSDILSVDSATDIDVSFLRPTEQSLFHQGAHTSPRGLC